jgi:O-methyltransferase involved in polyketide biosynthesis
VTEAATGIDRTLPHTARMWNYLVGGKDHYQVDRDASAALLELYPNYAVKARACRHFLFRAVRFLAAEAGVRQFLDIGPGLPTANNTHEVAQRFAPESRVVYVDNDPLVLAHARSLLMSSAEGTTHFVDADLRDPDRILDEARRTLDFETPIALVMLGILGHLADHDEVCSIVRRLTGALPPGSYLVQCDGTTTDESYVRATDGCNDSASLPYFPRSQEQMAAYYEGLELIDPGVVPIHLWRPDPETVGAPVPVDESGGMGRKI